MKKQINRQQLKKNQTRWIMTIVFICLLVTLLTPRKKADVVSIPDVEKQVKDQVKEAVGKALVENKIQIQKNKSVSSTALVVSAPVQKVFDLKDIKQKRLNAQVNMASFYGFMVDFHRKYNRYTTDLRSAKASLSRYTLANKTGFINQFSANINNPIEGLNEDMSRMNTDFLISEAASIPNNGFIYSKEAEQINFKDYEKFCRNKCSADENSFEIISIIPFDEDHVDVWLMNEQKEMVQVQDGLQGL